jgi:hypothetical protein
LQNGETLQGPISVPLNLAVFFISDRNPKHLQTEIFTDTKDLPFKRANGSFGFKFLNVFSFACVFLIYYDIPAIQMLWSKQSESNNK